MTPNAAACEPVTFDERTILDPLDPPTITTVVEDLGFDTSSADDERTPATECPGSTRIAAALPPSASVWPHIDSLARARAHGLALFVAEAWTAESPRPVVAYMGRFLERLEGLLGAMRALWAHACEPRTRELFHVDGVGSRAVQRAYAWCGALLAEFEELASDAGVMEGCDSPFARSRAEASALELLAFVRPAFADLRAAYARLLADDGRPHVIAKDLEEVEHALGALLAALSIPAEREPDALVPSALAPPVATPPDLSLDAPRTVSPEPWPDPLDAPVLPATPQAASAVARSEPPAQTATAVTRWSLFGVLVAMTALVGVAAAMAR